MKRIAAGYRPGYSRRPKVSATAQTKPLKSPAERLRLSLLLLSTVACATLPPPKPAALDPSNPDAPEAPLPARSTALDDRKGEAAPAPAATYTCPMHPEVRETAPGRCPKCGMALEPAP